MTGGGVLADILGLIVGDRIAKLGQRGFDGGEKLLGLQFGLGPNALVHVIERELDAFGDHLLHAFIGDVDGGAADFERGVGVRGGVAGEDVEDAVGIEAELHTDAGAAFWPGGEGDFDAPEFPVVFRELTLALKNADEHVVLVRDGIREHLAGLGGDGGVSRDDDVHQAAKGLDPERKRCDIEKKDLTQASSENAGLNGGTESDSLIGVLRGVGFFAEEFGYKLPHERHAGAAADEDDFVESARFDACIAQRPQAVLARAIKPRPCEFFEVVTPDGDAFELGRIVHGKTFFDRFGGFEQMKVVGRA